MLTLPIKKCWFDKIKTGEKKEEYREIKPYYTARFLHAADKNGVFSCVLRAGYSAQSASMLIRVQYKIGYGREEWGAIPNKLYYVLTILEKE